LLADFINDLKGRLEPTSIKIILKGMEAMLRVIDPGGDRSEVAAAARFYERTAKPRDKRQVTSVGASELYYAGIARMQRLDKRATLDRRFGVAWGDGLMMSKRAANPIRLRNEHASRIGIHIIRTAAGNYQCRYDKSETKNRERLQTDLPDSLTGYMERWLREVRPFLLRGKNHDAMWVTSLGDPMSRTTIYTRFCDATEEELDVRINPHATRHVAATSIAVSMPESVRMIPFILNNDDRTAQQHYNLADGLSASIRYLQSLERRRQQAFAMIGNRSKKD
jgi:integrase